MEASLRAAGGRVFAGACDVADEAAVASFFEQVDGTLGPVDILVNNAGITRDAHIMFLDRRAGRDVLDVACTARILRARGGAWHAAAAMGTDHQHLIAERADASRGQAGYAASKAGLEGFTRALSRNLAAKGVLVNAVAPGLVETEMLEAMPAAARAAHLKAVAIGRPARQGSRCARRVSRLRCGELHHGASDWRRRRSALVKRIWNTHAPISTS